MKQDMIVILDLGSTENTVLARRIRDLGVYSEIHPHDITVEELKAVSYTHLPAGGSRLAKVVTYVKNQSLFY